MERDETIATGDMLLHARSDWPCALCRPQESIEGRGSLLCVACAADLVLASFARLGYGSEATSSAGTSLASQLSEFARGTR